MSEQTTVNTDEITEPVTEKAEEDTSLTDDNDNVTAYSGKKGTHKSSKKESSSKKNRETTTSKRKDEKKTTKERITEEKTTKEKTTKEKTTKETTNKEKTTKETTTEETTTAFNPIHEFGIETVYEPGINQNDKDYLDAVGPYTLSQSKYPSYARSPYAGFEDMSDKDFPDLYNKWIADKAKKKVFYNKWSPLNGFLSESISEFMTENDGENTVYSPANVYFALAVISETTGGSTRNQILNLLGESKLRNLRQTAKAVWNANYCDDGLQECILANSLWLNNNNTYKQKALKNISKYYYASTFSGEMGSEGYNNAYRQWLNTQTGGLLKEQISSLKLPGDTDFAVASTVYFKAKWAEEFYKGATKPDVFHRRDKDIKVDFMHRKDYSENFYQGEQFSAANIKLDGGGSVLFILPDEGITPERLYKNDEMMSFLLLPNLNDWENKFETDINLSVPKFDIESKLNLIKGLKKMGVTNCFDSTKANFSPITDLEGEITEMVHGARAKIDEEGIEAAAYTTALKASTAFMPRDEVDFILDRPFIFVIKGVDGLPLFVGTVNNP